MRYIKHILFILFFLVFTGEFIQNYYPYIHARTLDGDVALAQLPTFTPDTWMDGVYQDSLMKHYEQNLDLHTGFIRFNNQIAYSMFDEIKAKDVVEGRDKMLFEETYIRSYYGRGFVGDAKVKEKVAKLKYVQDELKKRNIALLFVISCGKASYYPEYLPEHYKDSVKTRTNYDAYVAAFDKEKINYLDIPKLFRKLKSTAKYLLFPRTGTHWSMYGASIAADTVLKTMERIHAMDMPDYHYDAGELSDTARYSDNDIEKGMNIMYDIPAYRMYYPKIVYTKDSSKTKPNVLILGDSYIYTWMEPYHYPQEMFSTESSWWYYSQELEWPAAADGKHVRIETFNLKEQTLHRDFILIVYNETNLGNFDFGFTDKMYAMLKTNTVAER